VTLLPDRLVHQRLGRSQGDASGSELLYCDSDGFVGCDGALVEAHQCCLVFGGGEGDQGVVGRAAEDVAGRHRGEELLVAGLRQDLLAVTDQIYRICYSFGYGDDHYNAA